MSMAALRAVLVLTVAALLVIVVLWVRRTNAPPAPPDTPPRRSEISERDLAAKTLRVHETDPAAVLLLVARESGEIGPCGCLKEPGGGHARRVGLRSWMELVWPDVPVAWIGAGDWSGNPTEEGRVRTELLATSLGRLQFAAINVGPREVRGGYGEYKSTISDAGLPLLSSNLRAVPGPLADPGTVVSLDAPSHRILELGEIRVGVLGLSQLAGQVPGIRQSDLIASGVRVAEQVRPEVDFLLAVGIMPEDRAFALARAAPFLDLVYAGWGSRVQPEPIDISGVPILFGGDRGRWVTEVRFYPGDGGLGAVEFVSHFLGEAIPEPKEAKAWESAALEAVRRKQVELASRAHPRPDGGFRSSETCRECHVEEWKRWSESAHRTAFDVLVESRRDFDPGCQGCHVTGFGERGGFGNPVRDRDLAAVHCDACHGPSGPHAARPEEISTPGGNDCGSCHDAENDPDFDRFESWRAILHGSGPTS